MPLADPNPSLRFRPAPVEWFCFAVGLTLCIHYAWLLDDAYVYFRYVDNWLYLDRGLVYNPGEYAEGFTSPLWLMLVAGMRSLGFGYWLAVRVLAVLFFVAFWAGAVVVNQRLSPVDSVRVGLPVAYLCLNYGVLCYFSSGVEAPLLQLTAMGYALFMLNPASTPGRLAIALSPLVRPELVLAALFCVVWLGLRDYRAAGRLLAIAVLPGACWLGFRIFYYADLFPTTFYLKAQGHFTQGLAYLHDTLAPYAVYGLLPLGLLTMFLLLRSGESPPEQQRARLGMLGLALLLTCYCVWVGGDARHFRYLAFPFCLFGLAMGGLAEWLLGWRFPKQARWLAPALGLAVACVSLLSYPRQLPAHPMDLAVQPELVEKISDAAHHRVHPDLPPLNPWSFEEPLDHRPIRLALKRSKRSNLSQSINAHYICWFHYQHLGQWALHSYGLTDGILARIRSAPGPQDRPGHKQELKHRALEIERVMRAWNKPPSPGMYRAATKAGVAAPWMTANLATLEILEQKLYGPRSPLESLKLAFRFGDRINISND